MSTPIPRTNTNWGTARDVIENRLDELELHRATAVASVFTTQQAAAAFEAANPGKVGLWFDTGWVEPIFFDQFAAADGTPLAGRTVGGLSWVDDAAADVWGLSASGVREQVTVSGGRVSSSTTDNLRSSQVDVGSSTVRVSARIYHDGTNPGSGYRSLRLGLAADEFGALATNAGAPSVVNGIYALYEGGAGFRLYAGLNAWPSQGPDYTGHGTGPVEADMAIEYDGTEARLLVDGVVRSTVALTGFTGTVAGFALGRVSGWWVDDFKVEPV